MELFLLFIFTASLFGYGFFLGWWARSKSYAHIELFLKYFKTVVADENEKEDQPW